MQTATEKLMYASYLRLVDLFEDNNLSNHISSIKYELINNGQGFRLYCNDWVVFFNEYGTGIFNSNIKGREHWVYYKDNSFHYTQGQRPKFMFSTLRKEINDIAKDIYSTAISYAIDQKSYEDFKISLRG